MMRFILQLIVSTLAVFVTSLILPGVKVDSIFTALIVAAVLAFLNAILKPVLIILTIPITIFSFGGFLLVINALIILLTVKIVDGFEVRSFWWALLFSVVLWITTMIFESFEKNHKTNKEDF